jgi:hypothetical protein
MANCHNLFQDYNSEISIPTAKKEKMSSSKEALRKRIRKYFKDNFPEYEPKFFIQGSHKMKTGIRTKYDICDLDDGVYFFREPDVTATTLQGWILEAVSGYTETDPEHRKKCIRSIFSKEYEIDMPVYFKINGKAYQLAVKNIGWENSDAKGVVDWFNNQKDKNGQLLRLVKYAKGWGDNIRNKMPSGLAMTILVSNAKANIFYNDRDDITLRDTLKEIKKALDLKFQCIVPAIPNDDLFKDYDKNRKDHFLNCLTTFIEDAEAAIREENQLKSSRLWRKNLGDRFPFGDDSTENKSKYTGLIIGAARSKPWG